MTQQVAKFFGGVVPVEKMKEAIQQQANAARKNVSGQNDLLRLLTAGYWVFGQDNTEPQEGSKWAINPGSVEIGYIAWKDSRPFEEAMAGLGEPPIMLDNLEQDLGEHTKGKKAGQKVKWDPQVAIQLQCVSGDDTGKTIAYRTTSHGGRKELTRIIDELAKAMDSKDGKIIPIITLQVDEYPHPDYGQTFTPELMIIEWVHPDEGLEIDETDGGTEPDMRTKRGKAQAKAGEEEEAPKRTRRGKAAESEDDAPTPTRRRRRKAA